MQGTLNEIDIRSILQLIELGQRTGELYVEAYPSNHDTMRTANTLDETLLDYSAAVNGLGEENFWLVFFVNGQIAYAADRNSNNLVRLRDFLRRYKVEDSLGDMPTSPTASINTPEYACLWLLMENHVLTPAQGRSILASMVKETLFDLLSLSQGSFSFEVGPMLAPQLTTLESGSCTIEIVKQVQQWKQFYPHLQSPSQCPILANNNEIRQALPKNAYQSLEYWADGQTSLRQLSRYLNRDLLAIARAIYPYVQRGWIQLVDDEQRDLPQDFEATLARHPWPTKMNPPQILCIDDDVTVGKTVEYILVPQGYRATAIGDPLEALSAAFKLQPDLILCDIAMPQLDGYEICAMLRSSTAFRQTPIVMLTGKEGFVDRLRARMVGATDYLTKPFGESELLMLIEKYIGIPLAESLRGFPSTGEAIASDEVFSAQSEGINP
ncbi:MAG: response regulator [Jaaginema sp. PMC 1079.18]|nr:response regulator [Jaaginema sp. PMC 1080.18]MEC4850288.1 response regulator [Jaaginema sp. PMC 1079.18]MEC4867389.1 response regulator [Jaaginema sp. PMC 1078.18]